ncbi:MAG: MBL fold metallo-hydrolase [Thermodesulfobacteriota bacterium]|nr:MBL fold metallo-hydrolase [Thermodesulfobacteriota bacterium]
MIQEISKNLFFIERGWLNANHFVFHGKKKILIDTGYITDFEETRKWIEAAGVGLKSIDLIINTHSHCDHIGGNKRIHDISGCQIAIHRMDKQLIDSRDDWATWYRFYDQEAEFFQVDIALDEGESIFLDALELNVIYTPGHARGGIALYAPEERFLISSDALWDGDTGVLNTIVEGREAPTLAMESLEKLASLDIQTIYPGHGGIIRHPPRAFQKCRNKLEGFMKDPAKMGNDHLKKILVWSLLMKKGYPKDDFFDYLMTTHWFKAVVGSYFEAKYHEKFNEVIEEFLERNIVIIRDGYYHTTVQP